MSTIIKAANVPADSSGKTIQHVAFSFGDLAQRANEYVERVRQQAAQILCEAQSQAEDIRRQAADEGRQAAVVAAQRALDERVGEELETLLPALRAAIAEIHHAKHAWMNHWHERAVRVATSIAKRVIRRELSRCPEITLDLVKEALELAAGSADVVLRLHPKDRQRLGRHVEQLTAELGQLDPTRIVADPSISPGGCRVDTRFGSIDQQFEAQLARIEQELT